MMKEFEVKIVTRTEGNDSAGLQFAIDAESDEDALSQAEELKKWCDQNREDENFVPFIYNVTENGRVVYQNVIATET